MLTREKHHKKLYLFFTGYGYSVVLLVIILAFYVVPLVLQSDTSGVTISEDGQTLTCRDDIPIYEAESVENFLDRLSSYAVESGRPSFESMICTVDRLYTGTPEDRDAVRYLLDKKLHFWPVHRDDIEAYFKSRIEKGFEIQE